MYGVAYLSPKHGYSAAHTRTNTHTQGWHRCSLYTSREVLLASSDFEVHDHPH